MTTLSTKFLDGHVIVTINKFDYVVDTGSPFSFGRGTTIVINGKKFPISNSGINGLTAESLSTLSGLQIDGLIGMDILTHFDVRFTRNEITFSDTIISHSDRAIRLPVIDTVMTVPIISLDIADKSRRIFFDTGAKLSYLSDDLLIGTPVGEMKDFYPTIGTFTTNVYKIDIGINGKVETLTFGSLPSSTRILLEMGRTKGILGTELLNKYNITLSNLSKTLVLEPTNEEESFRQYTPQHAISDNEQSPVQTRTHTIPELDLD